MRVGLCLSISDHVMKGQLILCSNKVKAKSVNFLLNILPLEHFL